MSESKQIAEELQYGNKKELVLPSGFKVTIREQNGNDDDILSNQATARDLSNINIFLASLIIETDLPFAKGGKLTSALVNKILLRDKYYIIFASRIHSMGKTVSFEFDWGDTEGGKVTYNDDLTNFVWDYTNVMPKQGEENYYFDRIKPYPSGAYDIQHLTLTSGKQLKFHFMNGDSEQYLLKVPLELQSRNNELRARGLSLLVKDEYVPVKNFQFFSKRDMAELNKTIKNGDPSFTGITKLENPHNGESIDFPIMRAEGFFYPEEI